MALEEDKDSSGEATGVTASKVSFADNVSVTESTRTASRKSHKSSRFVSGIRTASQKERIKRENVTGIIFPWTIYYNCWWGWTVCCSIFTIFFETYEIGFGQAGMEPHNDASSIIEYFLLSVFVIDIIVSFNLAFYNDGDEICFDRRLIAKNYMKRMFWVDLVGVFPFYAVALAIADEMGENSQLAQYLALLRLAKMVRLHRVVLLFSRLQYNPKVGLTVLTLVRNFSFALVWTHIAACVFFFIARQSDFREDDTWIGGSVADLSGFERYTTSLYWSVVTFTTVGYGDFSPVNAAEQIFGMIYMLLNIILQSWIIGSITLLVVKNDETTGVYRETLETLDQYSSINDFDDTFQKRLKTQLQLDFNNREVADEQVLKHFPSSVRRRILRRIYLPSLMSTSLMNGIRQQFVDAFLAACTVEIFSPGEEILQRGSVSAHLYLLVGGTVSLRSLEQTSTVDNADDTSSCVGSVMDSEFSTQGGPFKHLEAGHFVNEIEFFTESPQIETVRTVEVCKTLTMSRSAYKIIADDHPGSVGKILQNLLSKVEKKAEDLKSSEFSTLPKKVDLLRAGSMYYDDISKGMSHDEEVSHVVACAQSEASLTAVKDLVKMHVNKQKDDQTNRFLFASSRGDTGTIAIMCGNGFDPNSADYDNRTALMIASMNGNVETVTKLLEHHANPNLVDVHGSSALYEAVKNGNEAAMEVLLKHDAELCMSESLAASTLCQAVYEGDIPVLRALLRANIPVDSADYDKRAAVHIAAAEGNLAALKVLVEFGADLTLRDRWNHSVKDEAESHEAGQILAYLRSMK